MHGLKNKKIKEYLDYSSVPKLKGNALRELINSETIWIVEEHDYSNLYDNVEFDGENFIIISDKTLLELNYNKDILFYSGVIFEMGRYLIEEDLSSLTLFKNNNF